MNVGHHNREQDGTILARTTYPAMTTATRTHGGAHFRAQASSISKNLAARETLARGHDEVNQVGQREDVRHWGASVTNDQTDVRIRVFMPLRGQRL